jgi:hypothetical protein
LFNHREKHHHHHTIKEEEEMYRKLFLFNNFESSSLHTFIARENGKRVSEEEMENNLQTHFHHLNTAVEKNN